MPRFFFHLAGKSERILDPDGLELANDAAAILEASQAVRELLGEDYAQATWDGWALQIVDAGGRVIASIDLDGFRLLG